MAILGKLSVSSAAFSSCSDLSILKGRLKFATLRTEFLRIIWSPPCFYLSGFLIQIFYKHYWRKSFLTGRSQKWTHSHWVWGFSAQSWIAAGRCFSVWGSSLSLLWYYFNSSIVHSVKTHSGNLFHRCNLLPWKTTMCIGNRGLHFRVFDELVT